ncbi:hypothetical protein [Acidisphaera rubrifaciens]|uniref:Uncharacterized protein n=1 Tax=Acidisphaera rubrifaciens HS-AP3 TaxID=1231350 RepID=A0A0D6P3L4_9PROT|nr:hypothetical protein [Acidisphaera rubrifaciens]GAN76350.1 hypothetical protein Asru_0086_26 [Acidisphaera rubrifaciens HS-AP3]
MTGDQSDMAARLKSVLPLGWFSDTTPVLDAVLSGLATVWSWAYELVSFARQQTRIATAAGIWLDVIANDLFGIRLLRRTNESDDAFRQRIQQEIGRPRATRDAIVVALTELTSRAPVIFEPAQAGDTGGWGAASGNAAAANGLGYGAAGAWGSLSMPFQVFVTAFRPAGSGIAAVAGWGGPAGYGAGAIEYGDLSMVTGPVTDAYLYAAVAAVMPAAGTAWMQISN